MGVGKTEENMTDNFGILDTKKNFEKLENFFILFKIEKYSNRTF